MLRNTAQNRDTGYENRHGKMYTKEMQVVRARQGEGYTACGSTARKKLRRKRQRLRTLQRLFMFVIVMALCAGLLAFILITRDLNDGLPEGSARPDMDINIYTDMGVDKYLEELEMLLKRNEEAADYVAEYPNREEYMNQPVDLTEDIQNGEVPLLMQWDSRWGYNAYGGSMIGLAGCGPVCLDMAYLYFTDDVDMTPREMADFAYENGYYTEVGTSWSLWTEGVAKLGLSGDALALDESVMQNALDKGGLIICSMRPGDFTTTGHFILIRGYDENGFYVNDPNRRSNSEKQWDYGTLSRQIKNLWVLSAGD